MPDRVRRRPAAALNPSSTLMMRGAAMRGMIGTV
jgi:hypothetical protein